MHVSAIHFHIRPNVFVAAGEGLAVCRIWKLIPASELERFQSPLAPDLLAMRWVACARPDETFLCVLIGSDQGQQVAFF